MSKPRKQVKGLWFEKIMAIVALINLCLVFFDISYISWHNFYLRQFPEFTQWYGQQFKGIESHRSTEDYLETVQRLEDQVALEGLSSPQSERLLEQVRSRSIEMIDENPFAGAGKSGTLERIKKRIRDETDAESSKQAFITFWSQDYLSRSGWQESIKFFNAEIRPLIASNYYRGIGLNGEPIDEFWRIDSWFVGLFGIEFLIRTIYLSRRYKGVSWLDAAIWRWYDLLLLIPVWRWLRVVPVTIRINQSKLVNLDPINNRIIRSAISGIAIEITEMVVIRIINQAQDAIQQGDAVRWLLNPSGGRRYIDINGINEAEAIANRLTTVLVYQVLPKIKPEIEALLHHSMTSVLNNSPVYAGIQRLPGLGDWTDQLTKQLVSEVSKNSYQAITASLEDQVGSGLIKQLVGRFGEVFRTEIQQDDAVEEIQLLSVELLEEIKLNYIKRIEMADLEQLQLQKKHLYELTQGFITD
ncbi:MAG: hypothetical protein HC865_15590 [Cyanobacteria bacterium RU_5_0]|nr:hypothetical protein [Cyanobacteria bacterium RU_5_0]